MIRDTSVLAYKDIINEGLLSAMEERVFRVIAANPDLCDRELADIAELKINQLTGRRNGLMEEGCIEDAGTKEDTVTNRTVHIWRVPPIIDYKNPKKGRQLKLKRYLRFAGTRLSQSLRPASQPEQKSGSQASSAAQPSD